MQGSGRPSSDQPYHRTMTLVIKVKSFALIGSAISQLDAATSCAITVFFFMSCGSCLIKDYT